MNFIRRDLVQRSFEQTPGRERKGEFYAHRRLNNPKFLRSFPLKLHPMKNLIVPILLSALCSMSVSSCGTTKEKPVDKAPAQNEIPFTQIGRGALFGGGQEGFDEMNATVYILRSQEEWDDFKTRLNSANTVTGAFKEDDLDFENEMVVACVDRMRGSGGHEIVIESISESNTSLEIRVLHKAPGDMAASVLTQPFHVVRLPKSDKTPSLKIREE